MLSRKPLSFVDNRLFEFISKAIKISIPQCGMCVPHCGTEILHYIHYKLYRPL